MEFKGTEKEWQYMKCQISNTINISSAGGLIVIGNISTRTFCGSHLEEETEANALLISKAPEMLEMLQTLLKEFKARDVRTGHIKEDLKQLIKQATEL